ncbi:type II toxin-antitoxin system RelE/ParE family toxin [Methylorubrum extorquens]|uniref:type II toxin-antitoxin system RelE/ParE family toxin n=1 Tax=Methylorubrum extorquens TaxID=408 RepID=UPI0020A16E9F|nr:phage-related protein [Methylorubrum extorquens]
MTPTSPPLRECWFVGSSRKDLSAFPDVVRSEFGHALHEAQCGLEPYAAKALKGFGGRGVLEIIENHDGDTFRAVYTVRFAGAIYVLHCFQKKSKKGIATPQHDIELIRARLRDAETLHRIKIEEGR